jgi:hypothetical protein
MSLVPGDRLGVYEIVARIGAGGMGEVYRAVLGLSIAGQPTAERGRQAGAPSLEPDTELT